MDAVALLIGMAVGLVAGGVIGVLVVRLRTRSGDPALVDARHAQLVAELRAQEAAARADVTAQLAAAEAAVGGLREQLADTQQQHRDAMERARLEATTENKVLQVLTPVQETLRGLQTKVVDLEAQRNQQHGELTQQLKSATESEERLRATAETLASALRNNATRGVWGETQLRTLVESAGLLNRVDFTVQSTIEAESGRRRPDMVITLPGGKAIPVDAKVPYNAYIEASAIPAGGSPEQERQRDELMTKHAKLVRSHVDALAGKSYWTGLDASPDFTIAFIPNEPLLNAAIDHDASLMEYAFSKRVILANPATLWALLKTIAFTWQQDVLTEDAKQLFDLGKELYARLSTLSEHADKLRRSIESTVTSYNQFAGSLEQRVLVTARKLDALDESKVIASPSQIDEQPKRLSQPELVQAEHDTLDELGVGRTELDLGLIDSPAPKKRPKTA